MKQFFCLAVGIVVMLAACKDKPAAQGSGSSDTDSLAVGDTLTVEQQDTTLLPVFLYYHNPKNMQVVFWTTLEKTEDSRAEWELQERTRRNAARYTKLFMGYEKAQDVTFVGEQITDPDGEPIPIFGLHHDYVPSAGLNYAFAEADNPAGKNFDFGSMRVLTTSDFLVTHTPMKLTDYDYPYKEKFAASVLKQLEQKYGRTVQRSCVAAKMGSRYTYGIVQFKLKDKQPLALEVLVDGDKVYDMPVKGYYDEEYGSTWNVDDGGEYIPGNILAAFDGPKGPVLCYLHGAPESTTVGLMTIDADTLSVFEYAQYYNYIDEERPIWKKDLAKMRKLYIDDDPENKEYDLTKVCQIDIDDDGTDEVWLRDKDDENGAFFTYCDGRVELIGVETGRLKPTFYQKRDGKGYLSISGSAGGPSYYTQVFELQNSRRVRTFNCLQVYGDIDECGFDGKTISADAGERYLKSLPQTKEPYLYWRDLEAQP
jgi:hypothetical protein